jgi:hypothetical protein
VQLHFSFPHGASLFMRRLGPVPDTPQVPQQTLGKLFLEVIGTSDIPPNC